MRKAQTTDPPDSPPAPRYRSVARDTLNGIIMGGAFGVLLLGVGLFRVVVALLVGSHLAPLSPEDARLVGYYVGSIAVAGGGLGAAKPLLRTPRGTYVGLALAGAFVGTAIMKAMVQGDPASPMPLLAIILIGGGLGAIMGCALAYGRMRGPS
jgi:hypothetical protein